MRSLFAATLVLALSLITSSTYAGPQDTVQEKYRQFLMNLGFEDYSAEIKANLDAGRKGMVPGSEAVLENNQQRYQIFNDAREIAVVLMSRLESDPNSAALRKQMIDLTGRMLALQPTDGPAQVPASVYEGVAADQKQGAAWNYIVSELKKSQRDQVYAVSSDIIEVAIGKENVQKVAQAIQSQQPLSPELSAITTKIDALKTQVAEMVAMSYADVDFGQTRYLGRAMTASLMKFAKENGDQKMLPELRAEAKKRGLILENFVGNEVHLIGKNGKPQVVKVRNGSFAMELSGGSGQTPWGVRPNWRNFIRAHRDGNLVGNPVGAFLPRPNPNPEGNTPLQVLQDNIARSAFANKGYSHGGMFTVKKDPETGIQMSWVYDNYPNQLPTGEAGPGGLRLVGASEQFALPGPYVAFGASQHDPEKLWDLVQKQIQEHGYQPVTLNAIEKVVDKDGNIIRPEKPVSAPWMTKISEKDFRELNTMPDNIKNGSPAARKAWIQKWYDKITTLWTDELKQMVTTDGVGFNGAGNVCVLGEAYCTQTVWLAAKRSTGIDFQFYPDHYYRPLELGAKLGIPGMPKNIQDGIIAPNSFAWQAGVTNHQRVFYPPSNNIQEAKAFTTSPYVPNDPSMQQVLLAMDEKRSLDPIPQNWQMDNIAGRAIGINPGNVQKGHNVGVSGSGGNQPIPVQCLLNHIRGLDSGNLAR